MREKLINIIAKCSDEYYRHKWIIEMGEDTDIECTEAQCTTCPLEKDCEAVNELMWRTEIY